MRIALIAQASNEEGLVLLLTLLTIANLRYLQTHPRCPRLYATKIRYERETPGKRGVHGDPLHADEWWTIPEIRRAGWGDCEDLACWRVAELRHLEGVQARPSIREVSPGRWHVRVQLPNGTVEDPSAILLRARAQEAGG